MDGIKRKKTRLEWHCTFGIAHCRMLHTIQVNDVIPILLSLAVGCWVAAATLVYIRHIPQGFHVHELCLMLVTTVLCNRDGQGPPHHRCIGL